MDIEPGMNDRVVQHVYASRLSVAALLGLQMGNREVEARLRVVQEQLDAAVALILADAYAGPTDDASASESRRLDTPAAPGASWLHAVPTDAPRRTLSRFAVDQVFAYAMYGHDFYRVADNELWAHESKDLLLSARTGIPLARRAGRVYYDIETDTPLYYEGARLGPQSVQGSESAAVLRPSFGQAAATTDDVIA